MCPERRTLVTTLGRVWRSQVQQCPLQVPAPVSPAVSLQARTRTDALLTDLPHLCLDQGPMCYFDEREAWPLL